MTSTALHLVEPDLQFHEASFQDWERLQTQFRERGSDGNFQVGIIAEELVPPTPEGHRSKIYIANHYEDLVIDNDGKISGDEKKALTVVSFPSYAAKEEIEAIRDKVVPMPETCEMLLALAQAKEMSNIILIEGDTAIGKTFAVNRFVELMYGPGVKPLDFFCNGQTDVAELHGMWVPKLMSERDRERWHSFLGSENGRHHLELIVTKSETERSLPSDQRIRVLTEELRAIAASIGLSAETQWEFAPGSLPRAYQASFDAKTRRVSDVSEGGRGFPLHVQEVGLGAPRVINALLEARGEHGRISDSIQIWRNGGQLIMRGPEALIIMSTNPSDGAGYQQRNQLDKALVRGVLQLTFSKGLSPFSTHLATERYFAYQLGNRPEIRPAGCVIELYNYPDELGRPLSDVVSAFHLSYVEALKKGEGRGTASSVVPSIDQIARLADYMLRFQVRDRSNGKVDLITTLERGIDLIYLNGLRNEDKAKGLRTALKTLIDGEKLTDGGKLPTIRKRIDAAVAEISEQLAEPGYSPDLIRARRAARGMRTEKATDTLREELLGNGRVPGMIKTLLGKGRN